MRTEVVMLSDVEAEIHYIPGLIRRLFRIRRTYTPIIRIESGWVHRYTMRPVDDDILCLLERHAPSADRTSRQALLEAAAEVYEQ